MRREQDAILRVEGAVSRLAGGLSVDVEEAQRARRSVGSRHGHHRHRRCHPLLEPLALRAGWAGRGAVAGYCWAPVRGGAVVLALVLVLLLHSPLARLLPAAFEA